LSQNLQKMKAKTIAGFVITCVGDNRAYSLLPSRTGITLADRVAEHVLNNHTENYIRYSFLERGSDERQYCSPLIDLPVVSIMRTKYGKYTEYHTSKDDLSLINPDGLEGGYECIRKCLEALEANWFYKATIPCEPQLGKRGLYNISSNDDIDLQGNVLAYADGKTDLIAMANIIGATVIECFFVAEKLVFHGLLSRRNGAFGD
jgi:aminopeptidase-like protein